MDSCDNCTRLEEELWRSSEHYVRLIVQHDQMLRDGKPDAIKTPSCLTSPSRRPDAGGLLGRESRDQTRENLRHLSTNIGAVQGPNDCQCRAPEPSMMSPGNTARMINAFALVDTAR